MLQKPIGEKFTSAVTGKQFTVAKETENKGCTGCAFQFKTKECFSFNRPSCHALDRLDGQHVIFQEV